MKKILSLIFILFIALVGWKGWEYYQSTYVGEDYYAVIKAPLPAETEIKDSTGHVMGKGFKYAVDAFSDKGTHRKLDFEVITSGEYASGSEYPEGTILLIKASKKRILEQKIITNKQVPSAIKKELEIN